MAGGFFLFVSALDGLAKHIRSAEAESHAEQVMYWACGATALRASYTTLYAAIGTAAIGVYGLGHLLIVAMMLNHFIDLVGCLKDELTPSDRI